MANQIQNALSIYLGDHPTARRRKAALERLARAMGFSSGRGAGLATMLSALADGEFMLVPTPDYLRTCIPQDRDAGGGDSDEV